VSAATDLSCVGARTRAKDKGARRRLVVVDFVLLPKSRQKREKFKKNEKLENKAILEVFNRQN
jgi:hypothetical protein